MSKDPGAPLKRISSADNDFYKLLKNLLSGSGIRKHGRFLLSGKDIISENLETLRSRLLAEIRTEELPSLLTSRAPPREPLMAKLPQCVLSTQLFKEIDVLGTHFNLLLVKTEALPPSDLEAPPEGLELIVPLGDPINLGALARSALAFGVSTLHLTQESAHPLHPKALKASAGAILKLKLRNAGALQSLPAPSLEDLWALDAQGTRLNQLSFPQSFRLLVGQEGPGLGSIKDHIPLQRLISIPTHGVESLNANVAVAIALYEYRQQH